MPYTCTPDAIYIVQSSPFSATCTPQMTQKNPLDLHKMFTLPSDNYPNSNE
jgi:hypothetical protein